MLDKYYNNIFVAYRTNKYEQEEVSGKVVEGFLNDEKFLKVSTELYGLVFIPWNNVIRFELKK
jgi:hypothetical protein